MPEIQLRVMTPDDKHEVAELTTAVRGGAAVVKRHGLPLRGGDGRHVARAGLECRQYGRVA